MSRPQSRLTAPDDAPAEAVPSRTGMREWLDALRRSRPGLSAAAFDTRFDKPRWLTGSAAVGAARLLGRHHCVVVVLAPRAPASCAVVAEVEPMNLTRSPDLRVAPPGRGSKPPVIERVSSTDLMETATDVAGSQMQVAAILVLDTVSPPDLPAVRDAIANRIRDIPRLRQRLVRAPLGCGRPFWVDDPDFDIRRHVRGVRCPARRDERALLDVAAEAVTDRLRPDRPLWSATLVTGLAGGNAALIVVLHHVLADGMGGLAVLAHLLDGAPTAPTADFPRSQPSRSRLFVDALHSRIRVVANLPAGARRLRQAVAELKPGAVGRAPRCSLNRPTGPRRRLAVARADLAAVRMVAHTHGCTVNDLMLTAVAGAVGTLLRQRGETVDRVVISAAVSARRAATASELGNQVGVLAVAVPVNGDPLRRLAVTAAITRERKTAAPGASAALLAPAFRTLARLGILRWYVARQRLVTTFVTNLRGPETRLSFLGATVTDVIPVSSITGNVTVAFAVLSYAGTLVVTLIADPQGCPDLPVLVAELRRELNALTHMSTASGGSEGPR